MRQIRPRDTFGVPMLSMLDTLIFVYALSVIGDFVLVIEDRSQLETVRIYGRDMHVYIRNIRNIWPFVTTIWCKVCGTKRVFAVSNNIHMWDVLTCMNQHISCE